MVRRLLGSIPALRRFRRRPAIFSGLPPGLSFDSLDELCIRHVHERLQKASYAQLSGWKVGGTYRLLLRVASGRRWSLIFKDERYTPDEIPALEDLPVRPGAPEFAIYHRASDLLARSLPHAYRTEELEPGVHYRYILEDLGGKYYCAGSTTEDADLLVAVDHLPHLHHALQDSFIDRDAATLLSYDRHYSAALLTYARNGLEAYRSRMGGTSLDDLLALWNRIETVHGLDDFYVRNIRRPIHGDYNPSNLHIHREDRRTLKVVDWEWTGIGLPHADLASLLTRADPEFEGLALARFGEQRPELSPEEHRRFYFFAKMERGLLDAAFLARQQIFSQRKAPWVEWFIEGAVNRVIDAVRHLNI